MAGIASPTWKDAIDWDIYFSFQVNSNEKRSGLWTQSIMPGGNKTETSGMMRFLLRTEIPSVVAPER